MTYYNKVVYKNNHKIKENSKKIWIFSSQIKKLKCAILRHTFNFIFNILLNNF